MDPIYAAAKVAGHRVLYTSAHDMLTQMRASRADDSVDRRMLRFVGPDLLIIDDLHHCQILELDGNSFRNPPRRSRTATPAPPADDEA